MPHTRPSPARPPAIHTGFHKQGNQPPLTTGSETAITPAQTCHNDGRRSWHHVPQPQQKHTVRPLSSRQNSEPRCRLVHFGSPPHRHRQRQRDMRLARREQASTAPRSWRSRERDLAICFWSVRLREPGRNKQSRTPRPTQRRVHGSQLDMYRWL